MDEAAFYGDLFASTPTLYACLSHKNYNAAAPSAGLRRCGESSNGSTTDCGFTFTGWCHSSNQCTKDTLPYQGCHISSSSTSPTIAEVITVYIPPS